MYFCAIRKWRHMVSMVACASIPYVTRESVWTGVSPSAHQLLIRVPRCSSILRRQRVGALRVGGGRSIRAHCRRRRFHRDVQSVDTAESEILAQQRNGVEDQRLQRIPETHPGEERDRERNGHL